MAEKHVVCQGAICICKFGGAPDKLVVLSHQKEYVNDVEASQKLLATSLELGATFEKNCFGPCSKLPYSPPCAASVVQWSGCYEEVIASNGGTILLEDSKATCPIGGTDCIEIIFHGQVTEMSAQNEENAEEEVLAQIYPWGNLTEDNMYINISQE